MKTRAINKTARVLVSVMILSLLFPVLGYAAGFQVHDNGNGTVTVEVYLDQSEYDNLTVQDAVYVDVFYNGAWHSEVVRATYDSRDRGDGYYYFTFDYFITATQDVYSPVKFRFLDAVTDWVYKPSAQGPIFWFPGIGSNVKDGTIELSFGNEVTEADLQKAFEFTKDIVVKIPGDFVYLPASALASAPQGATVTVVNDKGSYTLPVSALDFAALANELGVNVADLKIKVTIELANPGIAEQISQAVATMGGTQVAAAVNFSVVAEGNGKTVAIDNFGDVYASRTIPLKSNVNPDQTTGVLYDPETGEFRFIPAVFTNGTATLKSTTNSIYTVISNDISFSDIVGHWGAPEIEKLANKLVVEGVGGDRFSPDRAINRAEFTAMLVRSLALPIVSTDSGFSDVNENAWYAGVVATAAEYGLVNGYTDGTFRPQQTITREEIAAMVVRAAAFAGENISVSSSEQQRLLSGYQDAGKIKWGHQEIAAAIKAGIVQGTSATTLRPDANATRAQAAAMILRYLEYVGFID